MNIFKLQIPHGFTDEFINYLRSNKNVFWIRFGQEILFFAQKAPDGDFGDQLIQIHSLSDKSWQTQLNIVVQKGRLFQQHYPDVQVIYDCDRFLLVDLNPRLVKNLIGKDESSYSFIPLKSGLTLFEEPNLEDFRGTPDPAIQSLINELGRDNLEDTLKFLTSFPTRFSTSSQYMSASLEMENKLSQMQYQTSSQTFQILGKNCRNIIADKQGTGGDPRNIVIVTAHLDSIGETDGNNVPAPGADDNGSGVAGLMEIARVFQDYQGKKDLRLILFGGEEQGFAGSDKYVQRRLPQSERVKVRAVVNMDMIGFLNSHSQKVLIEGGPDSQLVIQDLLKAAATYTSFSSIVTSLNPQNSDHVSFTREHLPAVLTNEGMDITAPTNRIHSPNDTIDTIDYNFALEILKMNVAYIAKEINV